MITTQTQRTGSGPAHGAPRDERLAKRFFEKGEHVAVSVTIDCPASELYAFWRQLENLPRFMKNLKEVRAADGGRTHWVAASPVNTTLEWDALVINDVPGEVIAWRTTEGSEFEHAGSVVFSPHPGGRGTVVRVTMEYIPPAGALGKAVAHVFGDDPAGQLKSDLIRFKQIMETGELATIDSQPKGSCGG